MSRLAGKRALITGGTSGIGLETARRFQEEGAQVAVTGRSEAGLALARATLGETALVLQADAGELADQRRVAETIERAWQGLDILFVNAGDVTHRPLADWDETAFDTLMATNLKGPFFLTQALLPILAAPASVILCGSVSARIGLPQSSVYAASKAGLISLARTLSGELHARGVRVNSLSPGPTATPALGKLGLDDAAEAALKAEIEALVPIGRLGAPRELADAAVFLASEESSFVWGHDLLVDGGVGNL